MPEMTYARTDQPKGYLIQVDGQPVGGVVGKRVTEGGEMFWRWTFTPSVPGYEGCYMEDFQPSLYERYTHVLDTEVHRSSSGQVC